MQLKPATTATHKGARPYQEDRVFTVSCPGGFLVGILDGHGGDEVSHLASEELPGIFADEITEPKATPRTALRKAIKKIVAMTDDHGAGSTLSLVYIPWRGRTVTCAVMGDSPIIVKDNKGNIHVGPEHNVRTNEAERKAAEERGGFVMGGYLCRSLDGRGLQMARALGNRYLGKVLLRKPDIYTVKVNKDSFVVVASDGVFDPGHYEFEKAAEAVVALVEGGAEAQALVDRAVALPTHDNATAVVVRFEASARKKRADGVPA